MIQQRTVADTIAATGVALHSGVKVRMTLKPAPVNTGVIFRRIDLDPVAEIPAQAHLVKETRLATTLVHEGAKVATVEHLLAAVVGCGLDNLYVELDNLEVPIMDGSSAPFVYLIEQTGVVEQDAPRRYIEILQPVRVDLGEKYALLEPAPEFEVDFTIDFEHPAVPEDQCRVQMKLGEQDFLTHISRARTFGFAFQAEMLRSMGLAQGGSMDNAIVLDEYKVLNREGLRFTDELARHKVLDAVGDLFLSGYRIKGKYRAFKSGHELNNLLCRALLERPQSWRYVTSDGRPIAE